MCVCKEPASIPQPTLEERTIEGLNRAIANPALAAAPSVKQLLQSMAVMRLNHEMNRELDKHAPDREKVRELILQCATEKYKVCGEGLSEHDARRLQELFRKYAPLDTFNPELFESAVEGVFISPNTAVRLRLYSGADRRRWNQYLSLNGMRREMRLPKSGHSLGGPEARPTGLLQTMFPQKA